MHFKKETSMFCAGNIRSNVNMFTLYRKHILIHSVQMGRERHYLRVVRDAWGKSKLALCDEDKWSNFGMKLVYETHHILA